MNILDLNVISENRLIPLKFEVRRIVNAGYVGRDPKAVKTHIEELSRAGVPPPSSVPMLFPVLPHNITTQNEIEVIGSNTSGEVEFVVLLDGEDIFVGVGSDHTDRSLERLNIIMSKQVCPNILSSKVWKYGDVESGWDELLIQSWVRLDESDEEILYQKAPLSTIISASEIIELTKSKISDGQHDGLVIFSGTVPLLTNEIIYGSYFRGELVDLQLERNLICEYWIKKITYIKDTEFI